VVREGSGQGEEMTQALYAHMNNKKKIFLNHLLVYFLPLFDEDCDWVYLVHHITPGIHRCSINTAPMG
jgi:hypothetical protein